MSTILLDAPRVRNGQPATTELVVRWQDDAPGLLPILVILSNYSVRKFKYRDRDVYHVEEVPCGGAFDGRGFILERTDEAIAADGPDADQTYEVFVSRNGQDDTCSCKGFVAHSRCKHRDALRSLIEAGEIPDPRDRPAEADPVGVAPF